MNFIPLFTTARVIRSAYQIVLTLWLFYYLLKRIQNNESPRFHRQQLGGQSGRWIREGE